MIVFIVALMCKYSLLFLFLTLYNMFQMNAILAFKKLEEEDKENCPCGDDLRERLNKFHGSLMKQVSLTALQEPQEEVSISSFYLQKPPCKYEKVSFSAVRRLQKE